MKCIVYTGSVTINPGHVSRVSDDKAHRAVEAGIARYVPKSEWKRQHRIPAHILMGEKV